MSAPRWPEWENEFLDAAQVLRSDGARKFLDDWNTHADTSCRNNPVDLNEAVGGSTKCSQSGSGSFPVQQYTTHANAAHAFYVQTHRHESKALLAALMSEHPYAVADHQAVVDSLIAWGSERFAGIYFDYATSPPVTVKAPQALHGYHDLQRSINRHLPAALHDSQHARNAALRELRRARRVRL